MVRSLARLAALLAALALATPALAEEKGASSGASRVGVGIGLNTFNSQTLTAPGNAQPGADIYVPLDLGALRIEPSLGLSRWSADNNGGKGTSFNLGCGGLFLLRPGKTTSVYVGPRLFLDFVSVTEFAAGSTYSDSGVDFVLAGVIGAEWFADPRFSIGAEARLSLTVASNLSDAGQSLRNGYTSFATSGVVFFRFYL
jgi:hypothetical protein